MVAISILLLASITMAAGVPLTKALDNEPVIANPKNLNNVHNPTRDQEDAYWTYRFRVSDDGGASWGDEIFNTGDTGMWEIDGDDTMSVVIEWTIGMGVVADLDNNVHFIAVMNRFNPDYNPLDRVNGVYDASADVNGNNGSFALIAEQGDGAKFTYADGGVDANGNLFAIWEVRILDEEGSAISAEIWAARTTDGNWGEAMQIVTVLDPGDHYPHMTPTVGEFFYVIYQIPNAETELYDQYIARVPASFEGAVVISEAVAASGSDVSYYVSDVSPIDQDVDAGYVYFCIRSSEIPNPAGVIVGNSSNNGDDWTIETVAGNQRYPSVGLDRVNQMPYIFSNFGVTFPHYSWIAHDDLGYNGGDWLGPDTVSSLDEELLYVHMGAWTSEGRLVSGCNVWNWTPVITPSRFITRYWDEDAEDWSDPVQSFSIWEDGIEGHYITGVNLVAGQNNHLFTCLAGRYGETDIVAPDIAEWINISSYMIGEDWIVDTYISDDQKVNYTDINWTRYNPGNDDWDPAVHQAFAESYDAEIRDPETMSGVYYYQMPSDEMFGEALAEGDSVWFWIYADDEVNAAEGPMYLLIANVSAESVIGSELQPTEFGLGQNYPNPFNDETIIPFTLGHATDVSLSIYDINGRLVENLYTGFATTGSHTIAWRGNNVSTGVYFYILEAAGNRYISKLTLLR